MMRGRAFTAGSFEQLEKALAAEICAVRDKDPLEPVYVLAGSNALCSHLRESTARIAGGLLNVEFLTFPDIVSLIERAAGLPAGGTPHRLFARAVAEDMASRGDFPGIPADRALTGGIVDPLLSTFEDLAEGGLDADGAARIAASRSGPARSPRVEGVLGAYSEFRRRVEAGGGDINSRFRRAAGAAGRAMCGTSVMVYGFYDFNRLQGMLVDSLAEAGRVVLFVPFGRGRQYRFAGRLAASLARAGYGVEALEEDPPPEREVSLVSVPDGEEEAREIARMIIEKAEEGSPFHRIAVIPWTGDGWKALRETFDEAGIPWNSRMPSFRESSRCASAAVELVRLIFGDMRRSELVDFLLSAPIDAPAAGEIAVDPMLLWVRRSAEAGMRGEGGWRKENAGLLSMAGGVGAGADEAALAAAADVIGRIEEAAEARVRCSTWSDYSSLVSPLVSGLFTAGDESEAAAAEIAGLSRLDDAGPPSPGAFQRAAAAALEGLGPPEDPSRDDGVRVLSAVPARGLRFETVFLPGLTEGSVPAAARQDPMLKDVERDALESVCGEGERFSRRGERVEESELVFALACRSASSLLVCSYPRLEEGGGRDLIPSSYLSAVPGIALDREGAPLPGRRVSAWGRKPGNEVPLSAYDFDLTYTGTEIGAVVHRPQSPFFDRGAELVLSRWDGSGFTPYDGVFESPRALEALRRSFGPEAREFSPTSLESWASCPFAFFSTKVLGAARSEEPERIISIGPLERGTLVHGMLERVYRMLLREGLLPLSEANLPTAVERAGDEARRYIDGLEEGFPTGLNVFWDLEKERILRSLGLQLEEEAESGGGFVPSGFERWFGGDGSGVGIETGEGTVRFHGRIDRIDTDGSGRFRVIDYKTGKVEMNDQDLGGGTSLQLPVYLVAASSLLGLRIEDGEARYMRFGGGNGGRTAVFSGARWEETEKELAAVLSVIVRGISGGLFFAPCPGRSCSWCEARQACPSGTGGIFEIKAGSDRRFDDYLEMRGLR